MEDEVSRVKTFLKEFNEKIQSPTSDEGVHTRIGSYSLEPEDIFGQVVDWILNYLDNRKCPYPLAVSIAKEVASQISASFSEANAAEGDFERISNSANIYTDAINKLPAVCSSFLEKDNLNSLCSSKYATSVFAIKNKRRKMEDRYVVIHDLNTLLDFKDVPFQSYYAIFDGHSGIDAAAYASAQLHLNIARHPDFLTDTSKAIIEGFQITDQKFLNKCNKENIKSGCTAVVALIRENTVYLSWLGDSQAVLVKEGMSVLLTNPHKPDREDERNRIESLGGLVSTHLGTCRVNGLLAVSRAIGDPEQKEFITSEPDLAVLSLDGTEDFLILACDGLWDGMSPEDVSSVLYRYLKDSSPDEPFDAVAAKLVHQSKLQGSEDNITTIVVFLRDVKDIIENSSKFMTNSFPVQSHDFLSMNGNTKLFNIETSSEAHVAKPTILELNSASSKKLKNTANVLSSAGLESSSYSYQYVENPAEDVFQNLDNLVATSSQNAFLSHQNIAASCFAPETTALSELPTPPIDDMLASQQFENFYCTDLYKVIKAAAHSDVITEQTDSKPRESIQSHSTDFPFSQPLDEVVVDVGNMSLQDRSADLTTHEKPNDEISAHEAVAVASTVVSNAVETAVKCLSSAEPEVTVQSQLNPYAKPFVMKSFFEESESKNTGFESTECDNVTTSTVELPLTDPPKCDSFVDSATPDQNLVTFLENSPSVPCEQNVSPNDLVTVTSEEINNQSTNENVSCEQLIQNVNNDLFSINLPSDGESCNVLHDAIPASGKDVLEVSQKFNICSEDTIKMESSEMPQEDILTPIKVDENSINLINEQSKSFTSYEVIVSSSENKSFNICSEDTIKMESSDMPHEDILTPVKVDENSINLINEQNKSFITNEAIMSPTSENKNYTSDEVALEHTSPASEKIHNVDLISVCSENIVAESVREQESIKIASEISVTSEELSTPENNQNSYLETNSLSALEAENTKTESKSEAIDECVVAPAEKEIPSVTDASVLLENITKDSLSLINIQNELNASEAEVPSDHVVEDSKVEPVAVDLKSLPESIPEAEGVTEDVDSDSEKDGGWSYMKGNTISGSKSKPDEKVQKTQKAIEIKSNATIKAAKKDVSKPSMDLKVAKPKGTTLDKSKTVTDKIKSAIDKPRSLAVADKSRTIASVDKNKKPALEKKTDIKEAKSKVLKSTTTTKTIVDKTSRIASITSTRKEVSETSSKSTSNVKPSRLIALARPGALPSKTTSSSVADKNTSDKINIKPVSSVSAKPKSNTGLPENKSSVRNVTSTQPKSLSRPGISSTRNVTARPLSAVSTRTTTVTKSVALQKAAPTESKPKPPVSTIRRPLSATAKKPDVKEVKDSVNKQISAKKNITSSKMEASASLAPNRRVISTNAKSTVNKISSSSTSKQESSKRDVPKHSTYRSITKNVGTKPSENTSKDKEKPAASTPSKTEQVKNTLNIESDQKIVSEVVQITEEKFILESVDKEVIEKEKCENPEILENGSVPNSATSVEGKAPAAECVPGNL